MSLRNVAIGAGIAAGVGLAAGAVIGHTTAVGDTPLHPGSSMKTATRDALGKAGFGVLGGFGGLVLIAQLVDYVPGAAIATKAAFLVGVAATAGAAGIAASAAITDAMRGANAGH